MDDLTPLEDRLLHTGLVRPGQLAEAKARSLHSGKSIWAELVRLHVLTEEQLARFFGQELNVPFVNPADYEPDPQLIAMVGEELARTHLLVPLCTANQMVFVAIANPADVAALDEVRRVTGLTTTEPLIATTSTIRRVIDEVYGIDDRCGEALAFAEPQRIRGIGSQETREHQRVRVDLDVRISIVTPSVRLTRPQPLNGRVEDLSFGGARIRLPLYLPRGTELSLSLPLRAESSAAPQGVLHLRARITNCYSEGITDPVVRAGVQFLDIPPEAQTALVRLLAFTS